MVKKISRSIKAVFSALAAIMLTLCFGFAALGCEKDEDRDEYVKRIVKEKFGCERVLWYCGGDYRSELISVYLYDTCGYVSLKPWQSLFNDGKYRTGMYVLGIDKYENEIFIAIPPQERTKENPMLYSPRLLQWPFSYSFTEIAGFAGEYGYKYPDGIDNYDKMLTVYYNELFYAIDCEERFVNTYGKLFENAEEKYAGLDSKLVLYYGNKDEDGALMCYFIMQEGGQLNLYQVRKLGDEITVNIITYERNKQNAES